MSNTRTGKAPLLTAKPRRKARWGGTDLVKIHSTSHVKPNERPKEATASCTPSVGEEQPQPNVKTFNSLITALGKLQQWEPRKIVCDSPARRRRDRHKLHQTHVRWPPTYRVGESAEHRPRLWPYRAREEGRVPRVRSAGLLCISRASGAWSPLHRSWANEDTQARADVANYQLLIY